jgi:excisionase family DNA binding protein
MMGSSWRNVKVIDPTEEFLRAFLNANPQRREQALKMLTGEAERPRSAPLLLTFGKAAEYLVVSRTTMWRMIKAGIVGRVEVYSGTYRVRKEEIEALVDKKHGSEAPAVVDGNDG